VSLAFALLNLTRRRQTFKLTRLSSPSPFISSDFLDSTVLYFCLPIKMSIVLKMLAPFVAMMRVEMMTLPNGVAGEEEFEDWGKKVVPIMVRRYIFVF
jgi:hypothetical protein